MSAGQRRAVLYGRVSKVKSGASLDGKSVDQQLAEMTLQAQREQVQIVAVYRDDGVSASRYGRGKDRAGWQQVMAALLDGQASELWAWEVSRATRDREVWAKLFTACLAHSVKINVGGRLHDPADDDDAFILDLQAALAVKESARSSKRILRDVKARAAQGLPHGKLPYGYRREYHPVTRALIAQVPDPATSVVVREMVDRVLAGESMYAIAADLNDRGVPSPETVRALRVHGAQAHPAPWRGDEVRGQLLSPTLAGLRTHKGVIVGPASWPALITAEERADLLALLMTPGRQRWFGPAKHLLSGIAECGVCDTPLRAGYNRSYPAYMCPGPDRRGRACVCRVREPLDAYVTLAVVSALESPQLVERLARVKAVDREEVAAAQRELALLAARQAELEQSARKGELSFAAYGRFEAALEADATAVRARLSSLAAVDPLLLQVSGAGARARWDEHADDVNWRRAVVRATVRVIVHRSVRPRGTKGFDTSSIEIRPAWETESRDGPQRT